MYDSCTDFFQACLDVSKNESDPKVAKLFNYSQIQNYDEKNVKKTLQAAQVCWEYFSPKKLCDCPIQKSGIILTSEFNG